MKELLQRVSVFLRHVIEAPESSEETREAADELEADVDRCDKRKLQRGGRRQRRGIGYSRNEGAPALGSVALVPI